MNVTQMTARASVLAGDKANVNLTTDIVLDWLNDGQLEIARRGKILLATKAFNTVAGTESYDTVGVIGADFLFIRKVFLAGRELRELTPSRIDDLYPDRYVSHDPGTPRYFWIDSNKLYFYPFPDDIYSVIAWYYRAPVALVGGNDVPEIPIYMHRDMVQYAVLQAYLSIEDYFGSLQSAQDFESRVARSLRDFNQRNRTSYSAVRDIDAGWFNGG